MKRKTNRNKILSFVSFKTTVRKNEGRTGLIGERKIASGRKKRCTKQESKTIITNKGLEETKYVEKELNATQQCIFSPRTILSCIPFHSFFCNCYNVSSKLCKRFTKSNWKRIFN
jgi:hypothetical protein